jgi:hypothetical protein
MYLIPIIAIVILAIIAVAWSPFFALILAVIGAIAFFAYVGMQPRSDERMRPRTGQPDGTGGAEGAAPAKTKGAWGEREPE